MSEVSNLPAWALSKNAIKTMTTFNEMWDAVAKGLITPTQSGNIFTDTLNRVPIGALIVNSINTCSADFCARSTIVPCRELTLHDLESSDQVSQTWSRAMKGIVQDKPTRFNIIASIFDATRSYINRITTELPTSDPRLPLMTSHERMEAELIQINARVMRDRNGWSMEKPPTNDWPTTGATGKGRSHSDWPARKNDWSATSNGNDWTSTGPANASKKWGNDWSSDTSRKTQRPAEANDANPSRKKPRLAGLSLDDIGRRKLETSSDAAAFMFSRYLSYTKNQTSPCLMTELVANCSKLKGQESLTRPELYEKLLAIKKELGCRGKYAILDFGPEAKKD